MSSFIGFKFSFTNENVEHVLWASATLPQQSDLSAWRAGFVRVPPGLGGCREVHTSPHFSFEMNELGIVRVRHGVPGAAFPVTLSGVKTLQDVNEGGGGWRATSGSSSSPLPSLSP